MSVTSPLYSLLKSNFRAWISAKGFWLVVAAALLPLVLTGAWVGAHRADIAVSSFEVEGLPLTEGDPARFVATVTNVGSQTVGKFNVTVAVGDVVLGRLTPVGDNTVTIETLAPGESQQVVLEWNATSGILWALASADPADDIGERDEFNNQKVEPISVSHKVPETPPAKPLGLAGDANATSIVDLVVESITRSPESPTPGDTVTFTATIRNNGAAVEDANVTLRLVRAAGARNLPVTGQPEPISFAAGETKTVELTWLSAAGSYWSEAWVTPPAATREATPDDNHRAEAFALSDPVTPDMTPPEPDERLTIKQFYLQILSLLHLRILLPLIALFYAAGVIADEKEQGSLAYVLTRPIPRWLIPITKFVASFLVAAVATLVGLAITYAFLFGTTVEGGDIGFLTTPVLAALVTLFVYGALFILLGTLVQRPYLVGLAFVLAWENLATALVPWVRQLTLSHHIANALAGWRLDQGVQWIPETPEAARALYILLAVGVGLLVAASAQMRRREFEVG